MVKIFDAYVPLRTLLLAVSETMLVFCAMVAAVFLRFGVDAELTLSYQQGFLKVAIVCALLIMSLYYFDLYDSLVLSNPREVLSRLIVVLGVVCLLTAFLYYIFPPLQLGRGIFMIGMVLVGISLTASRELFFALNRSSRFADSTILLGDGPLARSLAAEITPRHELGMRLVGYIGMSSHAAPGLNGLPLLGKPEDLGTLIAEKHIKRIIVALQDRRSTMPVRELLALRLKGFQVQDGGSLLERISGKIEVDQLHPSWLIFSSGFRLQPSVLLVQRLMAIVVSLVLLLAVLPLVPIIALLIKLTSRGPVFYRQKRVGKNGSVFYCYKFRTMRADAEADTGPTWASDSDPRITPVGRFLRVARLDEIPQLWNVFRGDMNFVGPRPERPEFDASLKQGIPYYYLRQIVRPGITGWAQINCGYGASLEQSKEKMRYDLYYIKNMSLALDLLIVFQTVKTVLFGRGAR
ncbi:MAG: TIGR03013 family PEP-CTERM/XrtA system glycosyltransferase [Acidobacteriia bacterium]|nr:TIGR03013 family PEP-CTERM/XrtA system glycosyltransferase [Terriglobia bacterium]